VPRLGGASAGSPPIQDGASATGLLPVAQPETRLAARNRIMSPGFIWQPKSGKGVLIRTARTSGVPRVTAGLFRVSAIGREVVPQHQPHRDIQRDDAHRADDPPIQPILERPPGSIGLPTQCPHWQICGNPEKSLSA
jgi:hypothetical protein